LRADLADALSDPARLRRMGEVAARKHIDRFSYSATTAGRTTLLRRPCFDEPSTVVDLPPARMALMPAMAA